MSLPSPTPYPTSGDAVANSWTCNDRSSPSPSPSTVTPDALPSPTTVVVPVKVGQDCAVTGWTATTGNVNVPSGVRLAPTPVAVSIAYGGTSGTTDTSRLEAIGTDTHHAIVVGLAIVVMVLGILAIFAMPRVRR